MYNLHPATRSNETSVRFRGSPGIFGSANFFHEVHAVLIVVKFPTSSYPGRRCEPASCDARADAKLLLDQEREENGIGDSYAERGGTDYGAAWAMARWRQRCGGTCSSKAGSRLEVGLCCMNESQQKVVGNTDSEFTQNHAK